MNRTSSNENQTTRQYLHDLPEDWQQNSQYMWLGPDFKGMPAHLLYKVYASCRVAGDTPREHQDRYYDHLTTTCRHDDVMREDMLALRGKTLVCACWPALHCHCDTVIKVIEELWRTQQRELGIQTGELQMDVWDNPNEVKGGMWENAPELMLV